MFQSLGQDVRKLAERVEESTLGRSVRRFGSRAYFWLVARNYEHQVFARPTRTAAGTVLSYELVNRHRRDPMLAAMAEYCGPTDVIYDVGANVGMYALALATGAPDRRVLAFEPVPGTVDQLKANVRRNRLADQIEIHAYGLGAESVTRDCFVSTLPELSGFDRESATRFGASLAKRVRVPVRRLDDIVESAQSQDIVESAQTSDIVGPSQPPDVVKLDVEGNGPAVLRGGMQTLRAHRPTLFIEIHEEGLSTDPRAELERVLETVPYVIDRRDGFWVCQHESSC